MKIKAIQTKYYFIDNINIFVNFPIENASMKNKKEINTYFPILRQYIFNEFNNVQGKGISIQKLQYQGFGIHFRGSFFKKTRNAVDDINFWFAEYLKIEELIMQHFNRHCMINKMRDYRPVITISRLDIARNHKGNMTNCIPLCQGNIKDLNYWAQNTSRKPYMYGIAIGKRTAGTYFRAYDKRFDKDGWQSSLERFKKIYYVRKEWELKSSTLRRFGITSPKDLILSITDVPTFREIIYRIRKSRDLIMTTDSMLYKLIHDEIGKVVINKTEGFVIDEWEFDKMIQRDYNIFLNKPDLKDLKRHAFNPFPQIKGLMKHEFSEVEILEIIILLKKKAGILINDYHEKPRELSYEDQIKEMLRFLKTSTQYPSKKDRLLKKFQRSDKLKLFKQN
jgi:hypothetical protein